MSENWVKLHSVSIEKGWLKNQKLWTFWTYCLMKATRNLFIDKVGFQDVPLNPGQFVFGLHVASRETGLSVQEIRTLLKRLKRSQNITIKPTNKFSIITIVNWGIYQGGGDNSTNNSTNKSTSNQQADNKQVTSNQQADNKQVTTYKSIESTKKRRVYTYSEEFERFWNKHPRKTGGKDKCYIEWNKYKLNDKIKEVMSALENHIVSHNWTKDNGDYITGTKKWIENNMWTVTQKPSQPQGKKKLQSAKLKI